MADDKIGWLFVTLQAVLLVGIVLTPGADLWERPIWLTTAAGVLIVAGIVVAAIAALGLGPSLTASPMPNAAGELQTDGLYRFVRHPVYTGLVLALVGAALRSGSAVTVVLVLVTIGFFGVKARWEERRLTDRYAGYEAYAAETPRFVPSLTKLLRRPTTAS